MTNSRRELKFEKDSNERSERKTFRENWQTPSNKQSILIFVSKSLLIDLRTSKGCLQYPNVKCFLTGDNLGYAKGNNLGLSKVTSQYALILNPDATLTKNTLNNFLISAEKIKDFSKFMTISQNSPQQKIQ